MSNNNNEQNPIFNLDKIYVKDLSLEVPNAPQIFLNKAEPNINFQIDVQTVEVDENIYEINLAGKVVANVDDKTLFLIEVVQAGIFHMQNIPADQLILLQNIECPNILYPYLREKISSLTISAGFLSPVVLPPLNFAQRYQQQQAEAMNPISDSIN